MFSIVAIPVLQNARLFNSRLANLLNYIPNYKEAKLESSWLDVLSLRVALYHKAWFTHPTAPGLPTVSWLHKHVKNWRLYFL